MSELRPTNRKRIVVRLNKNLKMSPNKAAAQAVHAALNLLGVHPGEEVPVIVLSASKGTVEAQQSVIADHGVTEVKPGSITAGASWDFPVESEQEALGSRLVEAYRAMRAAETAYYRASNAWDDYMRHGKVETGPVEPFGHKD